MDLPKMHFWCYMAKPTSYLANLITKDVFAIFVQIQNIPCGARRNLNQILTQNLKGLCKRVNVSKIIMVYLVPMMVVEFILRILPQS